MALQSASRHVICSLPASEMVTMALSAVVRSRTHRGPAARSSLRSGSPRAMRCALCGGRTSARSGRCTSGSPAKVAERSDLGLPRPDRVAVEQVPVVRVRDLDWPGAVNVGTGHVTTCPSAARARCAGLTPGPPHGCLLQSVEPVAGVDPRELLTRGALALLSYTSMTCPRRESNPQQPDPRSGASTVGLRGLALGAQDSNLDRLVQSQPCLPITPTPSVRVPGQRRKVGVECEHRQHRDHLLGLSAEPSGYRDSNPGPPPWQGGALPAALQPHCVRAAFPTPELRAQDSTCTAASKEQRPTVSRTLIARPGTSGRPGRWPWTPRRHE